MEKSCRISPKIRKSSLYKVEQPVLICVRGELFCVDHNECNNEARPVIILLASGPAIPRHATISRMVALGGMAHHVNQPRDDHYLLTWTSMGLQPSCHFVNERILLVVCNIAPVITMAQAARHYHGGCLPSFLSLSINL